MTAQRRIQIIYFNRLVILALTVSGMAMDGFNVSDLVFLLATFAWLWMPDCVRLEAKWLQKSLWQKHDFSEQKVEIYSSH
jgi:hypothetical protein